MRVISWNVNGLRSSVGKGFIDWIKKADPDILCLQEIKLQENQIPEEILSLKEYSTNYSFAKKKGYSGVAVFSKEKPKSIDTAFGFERSDAEGRFLKLQFQNFTLINLYVPHGGRGKENLDYKLNFYNHLINYLHGKMQNVILTGDFNVAHEEIDLARPKENKNNIMFTQKERDCIDKVLSCRYVDSFRKINKGLGNYTWWPYFANARKRNLGWRIDYIFYQKSLSSKVNDANILKEVSGSDHCPVELVMA